MNEDQPDQAIRSFEQSLSLNPDNGPCYYFLSEAWIQKGNFSEARQFNSLAENYLKKDKSWMARVVRQADKIDGMEKKY